tara:strand:+ start:30010 stop:30852 length:843 start_codon:yes stop_codon:yes gene_type:complete
MKFEFQDSEEFKKHCFAMASKSEGQIKVYQLMSIIAADAGYSTHSAYQHFLDSHYNMNAVVRMCEGDTGVYEIVVFSKPSSGKQGFTHRHRDIVSCVKEAVKYKRWKGNDLLKVIKKSAVNAIELLDESYFDTNNVVPLEEIFSESDSCFLALQGTRIAVTGVELLDYIGDFQAAFNEAFKLKQPNLNATETVIETMFNVVHGAVTDLLHSWWKDDYWKYEGCINTIGLEGAKQNMTSEVLDKFQEHGYSALKSVINPLNQVYQQPALRAGSDEQYSLGA